MNNSTTTHSDVPSKSVTFRMPSDIANAFKEYTKKRGLKLNHLYLHVLARFLFQETKQEFLKKYLE